MYQYTTEKITLTINGIDFSQVATFRVAIKGKDTTLPIKTISASSSSVDATKHTVTVPLTQNETASLGKGYAVVQVRIVTTDGDVFATNKVKDLVDNVLDEVVV